MLIIITIFIYKLLYVKIHIQITVTITVVIVCFLYIKLPWEIIIFFPFVKYSSERLNNLVKVI